MVPISCTGTAAAEISTGSWGSLSKNSSSLLQTLCVAAMNWASSRCPWRRRSSAASTSSWIWAIRSRASDSAWASSVFRLASASRTMESAIFWAVSSVARMESSVAR